MDNSNNKIFAITIKLLANHQITTPPPTPPLAHMLTILINAPLLHVCYHSFTTIPPTPPCLMAHLSLNTISLLDQNLHDNPKQQPTYDCSNTVSVNFSPLLQALIAHLLYCPPLCFSTTHQSTPLCTTKHLITALFLSNPLHLSSRASTPYFPSSTATLHFSPRPSSCSMTQTHAQFSYPLHFSCQSPIDAAAILSCPSHQTPFYRLSSALTWASSPQQNTSATFVSTKLHQHID
jgi:hypothetical protein